MSFSIEWLSTPAKEISDDFLQLAKKRQASLTKPAGALGRLEEIAITLAGMQATKTPDVTQVYCSVFAADHGVAEEGVSAYPQVVTGEMIRNFSEGGAAINVLSKSIGIQLTVIDLGTINDLGSIAHVTNCILGAGTKNFTQEAAMSEQQLHQAMQVGRQAVERAKNQGCQLFIGGEMGIGNTSSATAVICSLLNLSPASITGPGTGIDALGVSHKVKVIEQGLELHKQTMQTPLEVLKCVGGFEIAALVGAYITCAQKGLPVLIDGFITTSAALLASQLLPDVKNWFIFSHTSAEPGHQAVLTALDAQPLIDFSMRLGEGSGAAVTVPLLQLACKLHNEMASFSEANVTGSHE